jgi:hypothetical protein
MVHMDVNEVARCEVAARLMTPLCVALLALSLGGACAGDDEAARRDGDAVDTVDGVEPAVLTGTAELLRVALEERSELFPGYLEAATRTLVAIGGGQADGVTVSVSGGISKLCTVLADLDQDGARETTLSVTFTYPTADMSNDDPVMIAVSHGGPGEPLVSISGRLTSESDTRALVSEGAASLETAEVTVYANDGEGTLDLAASPGQELVSLTFTAFDTGYEERLDGVFTLEAADDGVRLRVEISDDPETPRNEAAVFYIDGRLR